MERARAQEKMDGLPPRNLNAVAAVPAGLRWLTGAASACFVSLITTTACRLAVCKHLPRSAAASGFRIAVKIEISIFGRVYIESGRDAPL